MLSCVTVTTVSMVIIIVQHLTGHEDDELQV